MATDQPDSEDGSREVLDFYAKNGTTNRVTLGATLVVLACALLLIFFLALGEHLGTNTAARYVAVAGAIFVALSSVGAIAVASTSATNVFGNNIITSLDLIYFGQSLGYGIMLIAAGAFGGFTMVAAGVAGRSGAFRPWLCWTSIVVGIIVAIGSSIFLPLGLLLLWTIVVGVILVRSGDTAPRSGAGASGPPL